MLDTLQIALGSVIGKDHISNGKCLIGRNNQDAYAIHRTSEFIVAFINDGCGSGKHSEIGAWIAANALTHGTATHYSDRPNPHDPSSVLSRVRKDVLAQIRLMVNMFGGSFSQTVNDYFLFTTVGLLITPEITQVVAIGDGVYALESFACLSSPSLENLGPFPNNAPPYLAYDLVDTGIDPELIKFRVIDSIKTVDLGAALIGSDGVEDLDRIRDQKIPGTKENVGSVWQFWHDDIFYTNPDALGRRLRRCNAEVKRLDRETGRIVTHNRLLPDDTTLISIRKSPDVIKMWQAGAGT